MLGYRASAQRLVRASVPFWFLKMKGWGAVYALHDTGLDSERLGATPDELERYGVCVWLDEVRANGDRCSRGPNEIRDGLGSADR